MKKIIFTLCMMFCFVVSNAQYKINISPKSVEVRNKNTDEIVYSIKDASALLVDSWSSEKSITFYFAGSSYLLKYSLVALVSTDGGLTYLPPVSIMDLVSKITSVSSGTKVSSTVVVENYSGIKSSTSPTDVNIPVVIKQGFIQWTNVGTGTVTINSPQGGSIVLNSSATYISYPPATGLQYSGLSITLSGGANIQWQFSY